MFQCLLDRYCKNVLKTTVWTVSEVGPIRGKHNLGLTINVPNGGVVLTLYGLNAKNFNVPVCILCIVSGIIFMATGFQLNLLIAVFTSVLAEVHLMFSQVTPAY